MSRFCHMGILPLVFAFLFCFSPLCHAVDGMTFVDADDKTGYYVNLNTIYWGVNEQLDAEIAVVKADTNRMYLYSMHFDRLNHTYFIMHSDVYSYDTKTLLESSGPAASARHYGPGSMMQEIIDFIIYPEGR